MSNPYDKKAVKQILIKRDDLTPEEADDVIADFQADLNALLDEDPGSLFDAEGLVADYFGLEPDYLMDFLPF